MYDYISGKLIAIHPTYVVVEVGGIGYQILLANPYRLSSQIQQTLQIWLKQVVKEDDISLYGFLTQEERALFLKLISVSGIGPKSANSILASQDIDGFMEAVNQGNVTYLVKFPGVGKKTAQQIILDLQGKLVPVEASHAPTDQGPARADFLEDAKLALQGLGYSTKEIDKIWKQVEALGPSTTQEALQMSFKLLMK